MVYRKIQFRNKYSRIWLALKDYNNSSVRVRGFKMNVKSGFQVQEALKPAVNTFSRILVIGKYCL